MQDLRKEQRQPKQPQQDIGLRKASTAQGLAAHPGGLVMKASFASHKINDVVEGVLGIRVDTAGRNVLEDGQAALARGP